MYYSGWRWKHMKLGYFVMSYHLDLVPRRGKHVEILVLLLVHINHKKWELIYGLVTPIWTPLWVELSDQNICKFLALWILFPKNIFSNVLGGDLTLRFFTQVYWNLYNWSPYLIVLNCHTALISNLTEVHCTWPHDKKLLWTFGQNPIGN
jgi:hypothetical protein